MLIGIVSKDEHIKNHAQALRKDGYSVVGLGSSPTEIPPTVDLIILRTQSCSHGGSDTAFSWSRSTNKPLIVENGLSGIRSKLRIYAPNLKTQEPSMLVESISTQNPETSFSENTPTQKVAENNFIFPEGSEGQHWNTAVPTHRAKRAFQESLEILKEIPNELREQIVDTYTKAANKGKGPYFAKISSYYSLPEYKVMGKLEGRPLHFFLILQWLLLGSTTPTIRDQQTAYQDFCGSKSMKSYVEAATWIARNGTNKVESPFGEAALSETATSSASDLDKLFDELVDHPDQNSGDSQGTDADSVSSAPPNPDVPRMIRGIEDLLLEVASNNAELLKLVGELREEVKSLKNEVTSLKTSGGSPQDTFSVLENLRDRGAVVSVTFGSK